MTTGAPVPDAARMTLDALGLHHGTDKSSRGHGYLAVYEEFLAPLRARDRVQPPPLEPGLQRLVPMLAWVLFQRHACILRRSA
jgi:hypothetical protein